MSTTGRNARHARVRALMELQGLAAVLLRRPANFLWYTNGADNRVDHASPTGVADILLTRDAEYVLTSTIEAPRFRDEQTPDLEVVEYPWYEDVGPTLQRLVAGRLGVDVPMERALDVEPLIPPLRWVLDPDAVERYRTVGRQAVEALEEACGAVRPGMTELEAAGLLADASRQRGLFAPVLLVAADDRIARYRHPIPGSTTIRRRAMLVLCGEGGGLYANLTRFVNFIDPEPEIQRRMDLCEVMLQRMNEATRPGVTLGDIFDRCLDLYAEAGFPDEWQLHHQGGMTGYASREAIARPGLDVPVEVNQAYAWNPSITGAKAEGTILVTDYGYDSLT